MVVSALSDLRYTEDNAKMKFFGLEMVFENTWSKTICQNAVKRTEMITADLNFASFDKGCIFHKTIKL